MILNDLQFDAKQYKLQLYIENIVAGVLHLASSCPSLPFPEVIDNISHHFFLLFEDD